MHSFSACHDEQDTAASAAPYLKLPKAVDDFTRVLDQMFAEPDKADERLDELAKTMGADGPEPDAGPIPERFKPK
jgi:hypothetical protein